MEIRSNAKINLGLRVLRKREDGFHEIETFLIPIPIFDEISILPSSKLSFKSEGIEIDSAFEDNLCIKAYRILEQKFNLPAVEIQLKKNIPIGAGLGGGSGNAAFVLKGLNELFNLGLQQTELMNMAARLGSDCSFFVPNKACYAVGRGEQLTYDIPFQINSYLVLVNPHIHISTKLAYSTVNPKENNLAFSSIIPNDENWQADLKNDFEEGIFDLHPEIKEIKEQLYQSGAYYASMSGSGSSVYGLFREKPIDLRFPSGYYVKDLHLVI